MTPLACFVAIVLLIDISGSVSENAFRAQRDGTASAFEDPGLLRAIETSDGVAVMVMQFDADTYVSVGWRLIADRQAARGFAQELRAMTRLARVRPTAIGRALTHAQAALSEAPCVPSARLIDIATDGYETDQRIPARMARAVAAEDGVVINAIAFNAFDGLAHGEDWVGLVLRETEDWLRDNVATGFVRVANDPAGFHDAVRSKVVLEITRLRPGP